MARAKKRKWVDVVAGLLVGAAAQPLALLAGPDTSLVPPYLHNGREELVVAQFMGGAIGARQALNGAIDAQRQGDLDRAAALFAEAQARANDLTPDERRELDHLLAANAQAMKGREDARNQLALAEMALQKGDAASAAVLAKQITANELYLNPADKQRFHGLCQKLHVQPAAAAAAPAVNTMALANSKLQQARAELSKANLDAAESLAREVDQLHLTFGPRDDSPRRVFEDLDKARKDPKTMLLACRAAMQRGEMDRAEQYALAADKMATPFTFAFFGDSPAKALQEIQVARAKDKTPANAEHGPAEASSRPASTPATPPGDSAKARSLVQQGRQALTGGDLVQARKYAEQAAALKAELQWSEDNPARLLDDIARAESGHAGAPAPAAASIRNKDEALALLKQGREQLAKGEVDEAYRTAARLQAARHIHWGLFFEDTPDKLQADVKRAREQHDKEKSVELLTEARRAFEKKDYDTAERLAYDAQKRHGSYSILDLGDRPDKLLADIQAQRQKERRIKLPDPPVTNRETADLRTGPLAQQPQQPANNALAQGHPPGMNGSTRPVEAPNAVQARLMLKDARTALQMGDTAKARLLADRVRDMHVALNAPGDDTPENIYRDLDRLTASAGPGRTPSVQLTSNTTRQGPSVNPAGNNLGDPAKARQLVAEARMMLNQNRLVEAREKIIAAQQMGVVFRPDEDNPNQLYQQTAFLARQRIDSLVHHAGETVRYGTQSPAIRCQEAEKDLAQARQLAVAFGQDMQPIERTLLMVNQLRTTGNVTLVGAMMPGAALPPADIEKGAPGMTGPAVGQAPASPQMQEALQKLDQARLELRNGETSIARKLAEEAINAGARDQGLAVLRSIDAEERGQQALSANRAFDAVVAAYHRRDYRQASLMLAAIDTKLLNPRNQGRLREILQTPEMRPAGRDNAIALTGAQEKPLPDGKDMTFSPQLNAQPAQSTPEPGGSGTGRARATDDPDQSMLARTKAMREIKFQQLRDRGMKVQSEALERFRSGQTDEALAMLQDYLNQLAEEQLEAGQLSLLRRSVESRMQQFKIMKAQVDFANNSQSSMKTFKEKTLQKQNAEQVKQRNVADLMKQYNELFRLGKYEDAEALAMRVKELDPDNPMATAAVTIAHMQRNKDVYQYNKKRKEDLNLDALNDTDDEGDSRAIKSGITFEPDPKRLKQIQSRKSLDTLPMPRKTAEEKNIERKLTSPVSLNFVNAKLRDVINDLRATQAINIYVDEPALAEKGISQDLPVTIQLEQVALKSALNLLLHSAHLTYVTGDDVLKITTEDHARGKLTQVVYQVTDLVLAVENFGQVGVTPTDQLPMQNISQPMANAPSPVTGPYTLSGGQQVGAPMGGSMANGGSGFAADAGGNGGVQLTKTRAQTHEDMLIKLITNTIAPRSWAEQGGPGTIDYHPLTMALVINQTPDIQDQVADLLAALRRLQDQEVAVEVKFISIAEDFFERVGVNFNMNIVNKTNSNIQNQLTSGQFQLPGLINQFAPSNGFISGLTPAGTLTSDLNIPITQLTYPQAIPPFGGYPGIPGFGGLTLGLAFLSDIQVFLFMEAVQGDIRSNVMQAPKITLFNGQTANIIVQDFQFFVIGVQVIPQLGQFTYFPQTTLFPLGVTLTLQATISADRRFVRLSLNPSLANVVNGEVNLFPVVTPIFPLFDGTATGQPVVFTQFVQQPRLTRVSVQTTVAVPDGGTVLMGGLKRLSEGRNEFGPPVLSKIPYLNRLFRNTAYGRSAESLLIMVTPRIIIQAEEEEKQTGYVPPPAVVP